MSSAPGAVAELLVATRNPAKTAELQSVAARLGLRTVTLEDLALPATVAEHALECHTTFEANALAKARYYRALARGRATVADDSGLEVDALGGAPGVHSRRWTGASGSDADVTAANNAALLRALASADDRRARFTCVVALIDEAGELTCRGHVHGHITREPRGTAGFGYDPVFAADELSGRTFGEATREEKDRISHRSRALAALAAVLARRALPAPPGCPR